MVINQLLFISNLFEKNKINYVFLKGSAFLLQNYFDDLKIRMVGDIDILVHSKNLQKAEQILKNEGFKNPNGIQNDFTGEIIGKKNRHMNLQYLKMKNTFLIILLKLRRIKHR